jgi:hypothetical protein
MGPETSLRRPVEPGLAALVRVMQQLLRLATSPQRHHQRVGDELRRHLIAHRPADHAPRVQIQHHGEVQPAFRSPDVREVGHPALVRRCCHELPSQQVRCDRALGPTTVVYRQATSLVAGLKARHKHQPRHAVDAAAKAPIVQIAHNAPTAVGAVALLEARADRHQQLLVDSGASAWAAPQPLVEPAPRDTESPAHQPNLPYPSVLRDELEPHRGSFAK